MTLSLYSALNIFCIAICSLILIRRLVTLDKQKDNRFFNLVIIATIAFFVFDALWGLVETEVLPKNRFLSYFINCGYFICIGLAACEWFIYSEKQQIHSLVGKKLHLALAWLPFVAYTILVLLSFFFNTVFYIDDLGNYQRGNFYVLQLILCYGYMVLTSVKALFLGVRKENYAYKKQYLTLATFTLFPVIFGTLQVILYGLPLISMGITLAILQAHTHFQEQLISIDPLTQINNRNEMIKYLSSKINEKKAHLTLFILDLDDFKSVNDKYGHIEGDNALIRVSRALKKFAHKNNAFISRYAGDEFIVICDSKDGLNSDIIDLEINKYIQEENENAGVNYQLHISVGMAKHCSEIATIPELIYEADVALYESKKKKKKYINTVQ